MITVTIFNRSGLIPNLNWWIFKVNCIGSLPGAALQANMLVIFCSCRSYCTFWNTTLCLKHVYVWYVVYVQMNVYLCARIVFMCVYVWERERQTDKRMCLRSCFVCVWERECVCICWIVYLCVRVFVCVGMRDLPSQYVSISKIFKVP